MSRILALLVCAAAAAAAAGASGLPGRPAASVSSGPPFAVGLRIVRLVDAHRSIRLPGGKAVPRTLVTFVRYPASGRPSSADLRHAPPAHASGPFPLIVFGHGFAATPAIYARLLHAWTRAGYVVAAPVFPLENTNAPGGPNEADLVNQPADLSFVITRLLAANANKASPLHGMIAPTRIAVSGQSDGGETAFAVAYDAPYHDSRVRAAVLLSGSQLPGVGFTFPRPSPPLLATQGTADTINPPSLTNAFYTKAPAPKFLLTLIGATHLPPYTSEQPQLGIVERVTIAFLDHYLKQKRLGPLLAAGAVPGIAHLTSDP